MRIEEKSKRKLSRVVTEDVIVYTLNLLLRMGQDFVLLPTHKFLFVVFKEGNVVKIICFCLIFSKKSLFGSGRAEKYIFCNSITKFAIFDRIYNF